MERFKVRFIDFSPTPFARSYVNETLQRIQDDSPPESSMNATLRQDASRYRGHVVVRSRSGELFASAEGENLPQLMGELEERIGRQLEKWRSQRFRRESIRDWRAVGRHAG